MKKASNRRQRQRVTLPGVLPASMGLRRELRVINLSPEGAMIEHLDRLAPGHPCILSLRFGGVDLHLGARVVWCQLHDIASGPPGQREIRYRSGLHFLHLSEVAASHIREYLSARSYTSMTR